MNLFCNFRWKFVFFCFFLAFSVQLKNATKNSKWFSIKFKPKEKYLFHDRPHLEILNHSKKMYTIKYFFFLFQDVLTGVEISIATCNGFFCPLHKQRLDPPLILDNMEASCAFPSHSSRTLCFSGWSAVAITHIIDSQKFRN